MMVIRNAFMSMKNHFGTKNAFESRKSRIKMSEKKFSCIYLNVFYLKKKDFFKKKMRRIS